MSHSSEFAAATAVTPLTDTSYRAQFDNGWSVAGAINGGLLLAVAGRALRASSPATPDPLVVSAHYLGPGAEGPAEVDTRIIRKGRSSATLGLDIRQSEKTAITALATMGDLSALPDDVGTSAVEPDVPAPADCISVAEASDDFLRAAPLIGRYDMLLDPSTAGFAAGRPSNRGLLQGWIRLADGSEPDALALLAFLDAFPPVMFDFGRFGWAPTMELTAHLRAIPAPGWIKVKVSTANIAGGMFEEDCELWDSEGRLVAQSRQLARQPRS